jgi:hypothetical protein
VPSTKFLFVTSSYHLIDSSKYCLLSVGQQLFVQLLRKAENEKSNGKIYYFESQFDNNLTLILTAWEFKKPFL